MVRHPYEPCAIRPFCCCCDLDPEITCYVIAVCCIIGTGFTGVTNVGVGHWAVYLLSILNLLLQLGAGIILFLGTLWGKTSFKIVYCWILFFAMFTVVIGVVVFLIVHKNVYLIWTKDCHNDTMTLGIVQIIVHTLWLLFWDVYTPMVVLGNLDVEEECVEECY